MYTRCMRQYNSHSIPQLATTVASFRSFHASSVNSSSDTPPSGRHEQARRRNIAAAEAIQTLSNTAALTTNDVGARAGRPSNAGSGGIRSPVDTGRSRALSQRSSPPSQLGGTQGKRTTTEARGRRQGGASSRGGGRRGQRGGGRDKNDEPKGSQSNASRANYADEGDESSPRTAEEIADQELFNKYVEEESERDRRANRSFEPYEVADITPESFAQHAPAHLGSDLGIKASLGSNLQSMAQRRPDHFIPADIQTKALLDGEWAFFDSEDDKAEAMQFSKDEHSRRLHLINLRRKEAGQEPLVRENMGIEFEPIGDEERAITMDKSFAGKYDEINETGLLGDVQAVLRGNRSYTSQQANATTDMIRDLLGQSNASPAKDRSTK